MLAVKIVVTGAFNAGKTEFIQTISDIEVTAGERRITEATKVIGKEVAMDFGRISISDDLVLYLFGTPGQKSFDFMWDILSREMLGFIIIVDSTQPGTFQETKEVIDYFEKLSGVPFVIAANKRDMPEAVPLEELRQKLDLDDRVEILSCVAFDKESVKKVILKLLYLVLENM
jgi:small GTP-binding protein